MSFSIRKGREQNLCASCRDAQIIKGNSTERVICHRPMNAIELKFQVTECNEYRRINPKDMSLRQMEDIAQILVHKKGGKVGFVSAKEFRQQNDLGSHEDIVRRVGIADD